VNAGHNAPIVLRRSGAVERLDVGGCRWGDGCGCVCAGDVTLEQVTGWVVYRWSGLRRRTWAAAVRRGRLLVMLRWGVNLAPQVMLEYLLADIDRFEADAPQH